MSAAARPPSRRASDSADSPGRSCATASSCSWRPSSSCRSSTRSWAASRTRPSSRTTRSGCPNPWVTANYTDTLTLAELLAAAGQQHDHRGPVDGPGRPVRGARGVRLRAPRRSPAARSLYTLFTLGLLFPAAVAILPLFILVRDLGLLDNPLGIALPEAAFGLPLTIVILRPFFRSIPTELEDAASIDGCGSFGFFWRILLPLSRPVLATVAVLAIVFSWNQFLLPLVMLSDEIALDAPARA